VSISTDIIMLTFEFGNRNMSSACSSGDTYEGGYKGGKKNGKGKYKYCIDGRFTDVYEGHYRLGQKHGYGKMTYANGDVYMGNYKSDKASGKGKMVYVCKDGKTSYKLQLSQMYLISN
jgi:hypothetical protein